MAKTITTSNGGLSDASMRAALTKLQTAAYDLCLNSAGIVIGSSSKAKPKIANTTYAVIDGVLVKKTTAEVTLTTANNVANAKFNVHVLCMDAAGTVTPINGTEAATIGAIVWPTIPTGSVVIGFVIVNPTGTGGFVGGTTEYDDATVVPNAVFFSTPYGFNPNVGAL